MENKIVIVGSGAFGTAMAQAVSGNFDVINIFGIDKDEISDINTNHRNKKYFNGKLNDNIVATTDSKIFEDADIIMLAIPSQFFSSTLRDVIVPKLTKPAHFVNLSKGMDQIRMQSLSTTIVEIVPANLIKSVLKLSGPSFAVEVLEGQPTKFVLACEDMDSAEHIKSLLETDQIKITTHQSIQGVEYVSVLKNPLAILMGIIDGLGYKMNTTAFMFTEAIEEMERFLEALGLDKSAV
ncbi:MAG: hypothetical protein DRP42_01700 [Tenericutes bacterium]|nr:MAG: hypothetical protein DRP42_01700 [Mycoplasmatota bacterium]